MTSIFGSFSWFVAVATASLTNVVVHVIVCRAAPSKGLFRALLAGFVAGGGILVIASIALREPSFWTHLANATIYACFSYVYFHWNNMGETARRVRLLLELRGAPDGLTRREILERYGHREVVDRRVARLLESQQIEVFESAYRVGNPSVLMMARVVALLKWMLGMK